MHRYMVPVDSPLVVTPDPVDRELDARGLRCPMPLLKAKQAIHSMQVGEVLRVLATDPGSVRDFQTWSAQSGHTLLSFSEQNNIFMYVLRKCC